jgi:cysteine desulfurase/selenocysteine lyase
MNLVAQSWGRKYLKAGDEVIVSEMEHHANIVPWQMICEEVGAKVVMAPIQDNGEFDFETFEKCFSEKTRMVSLTHCSNTLGTLVDIKRAAQIAHQFKALIAVDGAQVVANRAVDVQDLDVERQPRVRRDRSR